MPRPIYEVKADLFRTLGHPARIRILEVLRRGEASVAEIAGEVAISGSTLSQHLSTLRRADVVTSRRDGSSLRYSVVDPRVFELLELGKRMLTTTLEANRDLLEDLDQLTFE